MPEETQKIIEVPEAPAAKPEPKKTPKPLPGRSYPGALIVVEGTDGSGKSTQLYLLKRWLEIGGYRLHFTEWNSSPLVKSATRRGKQRRVVGPPALFPPPAPGFWGPRGGGVLPFFSGGRPLPSASLTFIAAFARG